MFLFLSALNWLWWILFYIPASYAKKNIKYGNFFVHSLPLLMFIDILTYLRNRRFWYLSTGEVQYFKNFNDLLPILQHFLMATKCSGK